MKSINYNTINFANLFRIVHIFHLKYDEPITEVGVEIVDCWADPQRVHPVPVHLFLPRLLNSALLNRLDILLLGRVQGRVVVEQVSNKRQVELFLALDHILGGDEGSALNFVRLVQHELRPLQQILPAHGVLVYSSLFRRYLVDKLSVDLTVFNIIVEIANSSVRPSLRKFYSKST